MLESLEMRIHMTVSHQLTNYLNQILKNITQDFKSLSEYENYIVHKCTFNQLSKPNQYLSEIKS